MMSTSTWTSAQYHHAFPNSSLKDFFKKDKAISLGNYSFLPSTEFAHSHAEIGVVIDN